MTGPPVPIRREFGVDRRGWVLARRSISDPTEIGNPMVLSRAIVGRSGIPLWASAFRFDKDEVGKGMMDESKQWRLDVNVHRRILAFVNAARRPEDLMVPPPNEVLIIDERIIYDIQTRIDEELERELAKRLIRARDDYNPLHGFRHVSQLQKIPGFNREILDRLIVLFGPRFRGKWELLYQAD